MKIRMKKLSWHVITLLAWMNAVAHAQQTGAEVGAGQAGASSTISCNETSCSSADGLFFQISSRGEDEPAVDQHTGSRAADYQADRRVSMGLQAPGEAVITGTRTIALPNGGLIWATEDPALGVPELSVSSSSLAAFESGRITKPVKFYIRSNYPDFIKRYELTVYRGMDADLIEPIATLPVDVGNVVSVDWDGTLPGKYRYRAGDTLQYVLRAYAEDGTFDETYPNRIQLVTPVEAEDGQVALRTATEKFVGTALSNDQAQTQSLIGNVFTNNSLRQQNIAIYGSRVRIHGNNIPQGYALRINGDSYPIDLERKFVAEYLVPVGKHSFDIQLDGAGESQVPGAEPTSTGVIGSHMLDVDVTGSYKFGVALADITISQNDVSGNDAIVSSDGRDNDDILSDGRLAFYGKAKIGGKYLIAAQADTTERDLEHLFDGFTNADPQDIFRRLDPDLYYPVYGDDSNVYRDIDTMGRFYLRMDWDKNQALWGNFNTGISGAEYAQYVRSLYGGALSWRSRATNAWGDPGTELRAFGSEAQTSPGHTEFIGTGGSLYYLRHQDVLPGSEVVTLEVRDLTTGRVENRVVLQRGVDYEIDEMQGRILLTLPLSQITRINVPTLTRDMPLDGFEQRLLVDYEWVPSGFDPDDIAAGIRGKHWFGDHVGVGMTYVQENRSGEDYTLAGGDITLQAGKGTYLKAEYTQTESFSAPVFFSDNGGLSFVQLNSEGPREGDAKSVEARANFKELGWTEQDWSAGAWWREVGSGYSISRYDSSRDITEYGVEVLGSPSAALNVYGRFSKTERGMESLTQMQLNTEWRISDNSSLTAELRRIDEDRIGDDATGTLGALRYSYRIGTRLDIYGIAQLTLDDDGGNYADNDLYTAGAKYTFGNLSTLGVEGSTGDRGDAASVTGEYRLTQLHSVYGAYTFSSSAVNYDSLFNPSQQNGWTIGQRWRISNQVNLFNESQYMKSRNEAGLANTFGMNFYPGVGWNLGFTLQDGDLTSSTGGQVGRSAVSVMGGRTSPATDWQSKIEWRKDSGSEQREQWVSTNRFSQKINDSWRLAARFNYSETKDEWNTAAGAKFIEGNVGFAYRPWNSTRWAAFGRYTYLYDLSTLGQVNGSNYDQRSQIVSLEGIYKHNQHWEFGAKLARREGEVRFGRATGQWLDSATTFAAAQVRYDLREKWHGLAEYRWLEVQDGGARQGFLVGLDRDINNNFRIGVGYNFTEFSDDLTEFDFDQKGFFINITGRY